MAATSSIEWTESTWNPVTGCTKVSAGCKHCYAERIAKRLKAAGQPNYANGFKVTLHDHALQIPFKWRKPRMVFVNSMSDLFHESVPLEFIQRVFDVMNRAHERRDYVDRIEHLKRTGASIKFVSLEPLLGPFPHLDLGGIDWVIVGGESGPGARPMRAEWVTEIRTKCVAAEVPFFFKQWGGVNKKKAGRVLDGRTWDQLPTGGSLAASV